MPEIIKGLRLICADAGASSRLYRAVAVLEDGRQTPFFFKSLSNPIRVRDVVRLLQRHWISQGGSVAPELWGQLRFWCHRVPDAEVWADADGRLYLRRPEKSDIHAPPIIGGDSFTSEDVHGGNEAVGDVPDAVSGAGKSSPTSEPQAGADELQEAAAEAEPQGDQAAERGPSAESDCGSVSSPPVQGTGAVGAPAEGNGSLSFEADNPTATGHQPPLPGATEDAPYTPRRQEPADPRKEADAMAARGGPSPLPAGEEGTGPEAESACLEAEEANGDILGGEDRGSQGGAGSPSSQDPEDIVPPSQTRWDWRGFIGAMDRWTAYSTGFAASRFGGPTAIRAVADGILSLAKARIRGIGQQQIPRTDVERLCREVAARRYNLGRCRTEVEPATVWLAVDWSGSMTPLVNIFARAVIEVARALDTQGVRVILIGIDNGWVAQAWSKSGPVGLPDGGSQGPWSQRAKVGWDYLIHSFPPDFVLLLADSDGLPVYRLLAADFPRLAEVVVQFHPHGWKHHGLARADLALGWDVPWPTVVGVGGVPQIREAIRWVASWGRAGNV